MPTTYTWTVASSPSGGSTAPASPGIGTGVDGRRAYAVTRKMNPATGDVVFDSTRRTWATSAPALEKVLRCLRTEKGAAQRDLTYGIDWRALDNARANAAVAARQAVTEALRRFTDAGEIVSLVAEASALPQAGAKALLLKVSFADARGALFAVTGRPA